MLYFKTIVFPESLTKDQVEKALRKYALKRTMTLDFKSATINIGIDQLFLGLDRKMDLQFTRIKTSFELLLPKMIIKLSKHPDTSNYKIRLSALPLAVATVLCLALAANLIAIAKGQFSIDSMVSIAIPTLVFIGLVFFELKLVTRTVNKAMTLYLKDSVATTAIKHHNKP
ncbi:MAG TPA: hypothetical protein VKB19_04065 [Pedobacter sp.]|nr:hypothetical protein [Pedobacter sp.]